jgi:large subunit ribosomal protein L24
MTKTKEQIMKQKRENHRNVLRIKREDTIEVISGNDQGVRGRVLRVVPKESQVVVEGVNIRKRHQRAQQTGRSAVQGGIVQFEAPIHVSNVMVVCPNCDEATRVSVRHDETGRVRVCKKCGEDID